MSKARLLIRLTESEKILVLVGETYPHRELLKSLHFLWDSNEKLWYIKVNNPIVYNFIKEQVSKLENITYREEMKKI